MLNLTHKSNADYTEIAFLTEKIGEISGLTPYSLDKAMEEIYFPICWGECKIVQYSSLQGE